MENDIIVYTAGYVTVRLAVLVAFGFAIYQALRPAPIRIRVAGHEAARAVRRADAVFDDRC